MATLLALIIITGLLLDMAMGGKGRRSF